MKLVLNKKAVSTHSLVLIVVMASLASLLCSVCGMLGLLLLPLCSALLAVLYCSDRTKHRALSVSVSLLCVIFDVTAAMVNHAPYAPSTVSVLCAVVIALCVSKNIDKSICAAMMTLLIVIAIIVFLFIFAFMQIWIVDVGGAVNYFGEQLNAFNDAMMKMCDAYSGTEGFSADDIAALKQSISSGMYRLTRTLIGAVAVLAFILVGICLKIFGALVRALFEKNESFELWHFIPSSTAAIFYLVVFVLSMLVGYADIVAIAIQNISIVFTYAFAYDGLLIVYDLLRLKLRSKAVVIFILLLLVFLLSGSAIRLLALLGAVAVLIARRGGGELNRNTEKK